MLTWRGLRVSPVRWWRVTRRTVMMLRPSLPSLSLSCHRVVREVTVVSTGRTGLFPPAGS